jgi:putative PIN family toxin of toxin-antitoxin system
VTRAVLDTNTLVSGLGWGGVPGHVVDAALAGSFEIVTSRALLEELRRVLHYPKLATVVADTDEIVDLLALASFLVEPTETVDLVRDPDDNRVVEVAIAGRADVIVTRRRRPARPPRRRWRPCAHRDRVPRRARRVATRTRPRARRTRPPTRRAPGPSTPFVDAASPPTRVILLSILLSKVKPPAKTGGFWGGVCRNRTCDLLRVEQAL